MLFAFTVTVAFWMLMIPIFSNMTVTAVTGIKVDYEHLNSTVDCTGSVIAARQQIISYGISVKPDNVYVSVGDSVKSGQKLMDIDKTETVEAFKSLTAAQTDSSSGNSSDANYLNGMLSQYYGSTSMPDDVQPNNSSDTNDTDESNDGSSPEEDVPENVYADVSGVVTQVNVNNDSFTQPAVPLIVISDLSSVQIKAQVDESMISQVKLGQNAIVSSTSFINNFTGKVSQIYPSARVVYTGSGEKTVVDVIIKISIADSSIKPGLSADVSITSNENNKAVTLPYNAVEEDNANQKYVYICQNGRACRKNIVTGREYENSVEILSGVVNGDIVIANPSEKIENGQHIRLKSIGGEKNV
jgi:HlyD family secretion protein